MNEVSLQGVASILAQLLEAACPTTDKSAESIPHLQMESF